MSAESRTPSVPQILDACCGGRMWWWDKDHPLAVYMDSREMPSGSTPNRPTWKVQPDVLGDFREMPFADEAFQLVLFDPPHIVKDHPSGNVETHYGTLSYATEQNDLLRGFDECWRVLAPGGTLVFKWAGPLERVEPHFPASPIVGNRIARSTSGLGTRWLIFYKPLSTDVRERWDLLQENVKLRDRVVHLEAEVMVWVNRLDDLAHEWHEAEATQKDVA